MRTFVFLCVQKWNQMSRFQRKLILLIILVLYFVFLLVLQKYQAEIPKIVEDDVEGPRLVRISIKPFGKKEDQEENEEARKQLQTVSQTECNNYMVTNVAKVVV